MKHGPVIVTGMHRSGTSVVAGFLHRAGVNMGDVRLKADRCNATGYFEDQDFLTLQREMMQAATPADAPGHRDWGWNETETFDREALASFEEKASSLVAHRKRLREPWGWKDPRTSLLLPFWHAMLGKTGRYLLVYRYPWDTADSAHRLGEEVFLRRPDYPYRAWSFYNRALLAFYRSHRDQCLLVDAASACEHPGSFRQLLEERMGIGLAQGPPGPPVARIRQRDARDPIAGLVTACFHKTADVLEQLDKEADLLERPAFQASDLRAPAAPAQPRVSVIMPVRNERGLLLEAIASAERNLELPCELLIGDDGSNDDVATAILDRLDRAGYRVMRHQHIGCPGTRNRLVRQARAPYILPLDADNRLHAGFFNEAANLLDQDQDVDLVYGWNSELGDTGRTVKVPEFDLGRVLAANYIDACSLIRRARLEEVGGYDEALKTLEDWDLLLSLVEAGAGIRCLPKLSFEYRLRPGSLVGRLSQPGERAATFRYITHKHRDLMTRHLAELSRGAAEQVAQHRNRERSTWRAYLNLEADRNERARNP